MFTLAYWFFWVLLIKIVWAKGRSFFWPVFVGLIATPFVGTIWAIMMENERDERRIFRD